MGENFAHFSAVIYTQGTTTNKRSSQPASQLKQLNELDKNLANPFESVVALERRLWSIGASLKANDRVKIIYCKYCFLFVFVCTIFVSVFILKLFSSNAPFVVTVPANRKLFEDCRGVHSEKTI